MTADPVVVSPDSPVASVTQLLLARQFNAVPVVAGRILVGMLSRNDLLRALGDGSGAEPA
jgi:CBS domain-containing protein